MTSSTLLSVRDDQLYREKKATCYFNVELCPLFSRQVPIDLRFHHYPKMGSLSQLANSFLVKDPGVANR